MMLLLAGANTGLELLTCIWVSRGRFLARSRQVSASILVLLETHIAHGNYSLQLFHVSQD